MTIQKQINKIKEDIKKIEAQVEQPITHSRTITWGKTSEEKMDWHEAKTWCEEQGGRLPTLGELMLAYEDGISGFGDEWYWSAMEFSKNHAWQVELTVGGANFDNKDFSCYVRCVLDK